jgi:signal peptidase I
MTEVKGPEPVEPPSGLKVKTAPNALNRLVIVFAVVVSLVTFVSRVFLFQPFSVMSESMRPNLEPGDYVWASKWNYGFSRFSIPFQPEGLKGRLFERAPERGDLVVFKLPRDNKTDYIKRLVGLSGDSIQVSGGRLIINGTPVRYEKLEPETIKDDLGKSTKVSRFRETLPTGASYVVYDLMPNGPFDDTAVFVVPQGHYFMMGDNRDNSTDSRADPVLQAGVGYVPDENLIGHVMVANSGSSK